MKQSPIPVWVVHNHPCCGMVVSLEAKELGNDTTGVAWMCPLHGEVNADDCRILSRQGDLPGFRSLCD